MRARCLHTDQIRVTGSDSNGCDERVRTGDTWVHLGLCLTCGHVGCCDSSKNKLATRGFHSTLHPLVRSIQPSESWVWCHVDELMAGEL